MWEYCTTALKICETSAWRRITAARVCRQFPEAFELVAKGELQLSVLAALSKRITPSNAGELFEACRGKSIRLVEQLLAARFPSPDVRDLVCRLPARPSLPTQVAVESTSRAGSDTGTESLERKPTGAELQLPASAPVPVTPAVRHGSFEPLSLDRFAVRFTADAGFLELLEQVRDLASHRDHAADLLSTLKASLGAYRRELSKTRFAVGRQSRVKSSNSTTVAQVGRRHVPAAVAREVYERDCGQCSYISKAGRRCSARRTLELDHIEPSAIGGPENAQNFRLRCRAHNQHYARQYFGRSYMCAVMKRVRSARADGTGASSKQRK